MVIFSKATVASHRAVVIKWKGKLLVVYCATSWSQSLFELQQFKKVKVDNDKSLLLKLAAYCIRCGICRNLARKI